MIRIALFFLSVCLPLSSSASHWESTPWVDLEVSVKAPDPFGLITFKFNTAKDGKLSSFIVKKGNRVTEVPSIHFSKLERPQLSSIEISNDAGFSSFDEKEDGSIYLQSITSILSVHIYYGEPVKGTEEYPYLACTFIETGELDSCGTYP